MVEIRGIGSTRRIVVILAPLAAAVAVLPVLAVMLRSRLPSEAVFPSDHAGGGQDGASWAVLVAVTSGWLLVGTVGICLWLYHHRLSPVGMRWPAAFTWAAGAAVIIRSVWLVTGNLDADGVRPSPSVWWASAVATAIIASAAAALGWVLTGKNPVPADATTGPGPDAPRLHLRPQERAMWSRNVFSRHAFGTAGLLALAAVSGLSTPGLRAVGSLAGAAAIGVALQVSVRVRVDTQAVTVTQPLLRRALITLAYRHVEQAYVDASPTGLPSRTYGVVAAGPVFGYRSRATGPALRLRLADGRDCVLTVDDPTTAAGLVNTYLDHLRSPEDAQDRTC